MIRVRNASDERSAWVSYRFSNFIRKIQVEPINLVLHSITLLRLQTDNEKPTIWPVPVYDEAFLC